ncbi:MAG: diadenylate cyclase CdaA [Sporomusaceae bacterium]|jgi:diadenylate cyclase|nr:diadenylate cyclase CdaA [Sporomusaceae bacterium]
MLLHLQGLVSTLSFLDLIDIVIVAVVVYKLYFVLKNTQAMTLVKGLVLLLAVMVVSKWLGLNVINWLLQKFMTIVLVALPVVFQPELRRALAHLGRGGFFSDSLITNAVEQERFFQELARTVAMLSENKIGALIVLERETGLNDYIDTGIKIDGLVTSEFLTNVFIPNTPMHDGAVIIRGNRVQAAGCLLPLTQDRTLSKELGTRHRAAIGISEQTDAVIVVVSEETGIISIARGGRLVRYFDTDKMIEYLQPLFAYKSSSPLNNFFSHRS